MKRVLIIAVIVAIPAGWIAYASIRRAGFDDGWEAGRCFDWKQMNSMSQYYGFDRTKINDTERESFERSCDIVSGWRPR